MADCFVPDWSVPANVHAMQTLRGGGCSPAPWRSLNLGDHVGDDLTRVLQNRAALRRILPAEPLWLKQVHGLVVADAEADYKGLAPEADAAWARQPGRVCAVMTADCLPVLFCDREGTVVAAAHAGWRGLLAGVLEMTVARMQVAPHNILAWLGPAIGPQSFEVGEDVRMAFVERNHLARSAFQAHGPGKYLADIYALARQRLSATGIGSISGGTACTVSEPENYFSYRRDGVTGRMASLIWLS